MVGMVKKFGMRMVKCKILICFVVFVLFFSWFVQVCFADADEAEEALIDAEEGLASAYVVVAEAEDAGANVSELVVKLEFAGALLAEAYNSNRTGDYDEAYSLAVDCSECVNGVVDEALGLKLEAENVYRGRLFVTAAVSSAALCVFFVLSLFGWRFLKGRYFKRVLGMKPEVGEG